MEHLLTQGYQYVLTLMGNMQTSKLRCIETVNIITITFCPAWLWFCADISIYSWLSKMIHILLNDLLYSHTLPASLLKKWCYRLLSLLYALAAGILYYWNVCCGHVVYISAHVITIMNLAIALMNMQQSTGTYTLHIPVWLLRTKWAWIYRYWATVKLWCGSVFL